MKKQARDCRQQQGSGGRAALAMAEDETRRLSEALAKKENDLRKVCQVLATVQDKGRAEELVQQNEELAARVKALEGQLAKHSDGAAAGEGADIAAARQAKLRELEQRNESLAMQVKTLKEALEITTEPSEALQKELADIKSEKSRSAEKIKSLEETIVALRHGNQKAEATTQSDLVSAKAENQQLATRLADSQTEMNSLRQKLADEARRADTLDEKAKILAEKISSSQAQVSALQSELSKNQTTVEELKRANEASAKSSQTSSQELEAKIRQQAEELEQQGEKLKTASRRRAQAQSQLASAQSSLDEKSKALEDLEREHAGVKSRADTLDAKTQHLEQALSACQAKLSEREELLEAKTEKAESLAKLSQENETALELARSELAQATSELQDVSGKLASTLQTVEDQTKEHKIATKLKGNLIKELQSQLSKERELAENLSKRIQAAESKAEESKSALRESERRLSELERAAQQRQQQHENEIEQLKSKGAPRLKNLFSSFSSSNLRENSKGATDSDNKVSNSALPPVKPEEVSVSSMMASRLEKLLLENEKLREKERMLQSNIQSYVEEIERLRGGQTPARRRSLKETEVSI